MKNICALALTAGVLTLSVVSPVFADVVTGKVLAFDRKALVIVLEDKTIYEIEDKNFPIEEGLKAGDMVEIDSDGEGEEGYGTITALKIIK